MSAPPRNDLARFVEGLFPGAELAPLRGDASTRRFWRLSRPEGGTRVVMDYGGSFEGETDDVRLERIFRAADLPVARIETVSPEAGCLILEDLGDTTLESVIQDPRSGSSDREKGLPSRETFFLYSEAVELAVALAVRGTSALRASDRAAGPVLDATRFRFEMDFFIEHYASGLRGVRGDLRDLSGVLHSLADAAARTPVSVMCHRDFHSRNLMVRGNGALAMVDIQDARWGPHGYDLASLLFDAYVDIDRDLVATMIEAYLDETPADPSRDAFMERWEIVAAQRMIKALGTFGFQVAARHDRRYLEGVPRTLARLARLLPEHRFLLQIGRLFADLGLLESPAGDPTA